MTLSSFSSFCSTEIKFLNPDELNKILLEMNISNAVLIMSKNGAKRWDLTELVQKLQQKCESFVWIDKVSSNPTAEDINNALNIIGPNLVDCIIAIGGGSAIDLAKGISAFYDSKKILDANLITMSIKDMSYISCKGIDIIAVPTTAGTGSEVTQWATVWDIIQKEKYSIDCPQIKPKIAYIVPELTISMSKELTLSTGLDSLSHAVEAYWSKHTNSMVQDIAYRAVQIIINNLRGAIDNPNDVYLREKMSRASLLAGLAFSQTRTTACHAISYPLTMYYGVPHGFAVALTLAGVAEMNRGHFSNDEDLFDLFLEYGDIRRWLDSVCKDVVELNLKSFGVDDISVILNNSFTKGRMDNNPRILIISDLINLFQR